MSNDSESAIRRLDIWSRRQSKSAKSFDVLSRMSFKKSDSFGPKWSEIREKGLSHKELRKGGRPASYYKWSEVYSAKKYNNLAVTIMNRWEFLYLHVNSKGSPYK